MLSMNYTEEYILEQSVVSDGSCDDGCNYLIIFLVVAAVALLTLAVLVVPNVVVTIR